jgi:D-alanyl-D-alanine carboxypeptidase
MMNEKASEIGMKNSSFRNPNGLDEEGHYSSAREMALLSAYAMKNGTFRKITGTKKGYFAGRYMTNHNELLFRLEGVTGIKTGYTVASGRCLVSSYDRGGREIIVVTLNGRSDWQDHTALSNKAYSEYKPVTAAEQGNVYAYIPVMSGDIPTVGVYLEESCKLWIAEGEKIETVIYLPKFVYAPVCKGAAAGEMSFILAGREIKRIPLRYDSDVTAVDQCPGLFPNIAKFFKNIVRRLGFCYNSIFSNGWSVLKGRTR